MQQNFLFILLVRSHVRPRNFTEEPDFIYFADFIPFSFFLDFFIFRQLSEIFIAGYFQLLEFYE